ncbi:MAG: beta-glucosidase [Anaerolineales bacterium]|nr:beta-glucosidase [Anaerolineales bacterium]
MAKFLSFPDSFIWGASTASYQIEGAVKEDGRGKSIWDHFSHTPGNIQNGDTGDAACDHYHRWEEDLALLQRMEVKAYRFSIAWPRILPDGNGPANQPGLDFYSRLIDALLEADILPYVTLYHWDLPQVLQEQGGWARRSTADAFVNYADIVSRALGDRVKSWATHNEPACITWNGHRYGDHAPGIKDLRTALQVSHHLLLSHGLAVPVLKQNSPSAETGIVLNTCWDVPASKSQADRDLARLHEGLYSRWFSDPLYGFGYPNDICQDLGIAPEEMSWIKDGDMHIISVPCDYLGINYYNRKIHRDAASENNLPQEVFEKQAGKDNWTDMGWENYPEGIYNVLLRTTYRYQPHKLYIMENGCSYNDGPGPDGKVHDIHRINYLKTHIAVCQQAVEAGAPLAGYFVWSFMDNFEWGRGYSQRFGLVHIDYENLVRTPKDSFFWYSQLCHHNGLEKPG